MLTKNDNSSLLIVNIFNMAKIQMSSYPLVILMFGIIFPNIVIYLLSFFVPLATLQIYDRIIPNAGKDTAYFLIVITVGIALVESVLRLLTSYLSNLTQVRYIHKLRCDLFKKIIHSKVEYLHNIGFGSCMHTLHSLGKLKHNSSGNFVHLILDIPFVISCIMVIGYFDQRLAIVPTVVLTLILVRVYIYLISKVENEENHDLYEEKKSSIIGTMYNNTDFIKSINSEEKIISDYEHYHFKNIHETAEIKKGSLTLNSFIQFMGVINSVFIIGVAAHLVIKEEITLGVMTSSMIIAGKIIGSLGRFVSVSQNYLSLSVLYKKIDKIHFLESELVRKKELVSNYQSGNGILFDNVSYVTPDGVNFNNIHFEIPHRSVVKINGDNEGFRNIIIELLSRQVNVSGGQIIIGENNIEDYSIDLYRKKVRYIGKNDTLYYGTIMQNLTNFIDEVNDNKSSFVKILCRQFKIWEKIMDMPKAFDTMLDARTIKIIPKGMAQLFCIIRAIVDEPDILLFDDATLSLDLKEDALIREVLDRVRQFSTIIILSHKPAIYSLADKTINVNNQGIYLEDLNGRFKKSA